MERENVLFTEFILSSITKQAELRSFRGRLEGMNFFDTELVFKDRSKFCKSCIQDGQF